MAGEIPQAWQDRAKELLGGEVFTMDAPGKWEGKQKGHTPVVAVEGGSATVKVPHVMKKGETDDDDHFIEMVFVMDSEGNLAAVAKFTPTDAEPTLAFTPVEGKTYQPYGFCNLHGLWRGSDFTA
eukprot:m.26522 g.26522  ORF g.26522 m.26522 type:complete len:125 (+) comp8837_c0_seq1:193-567(+)